MRFLDAVKNRYQIIAGDLVPFRRKDGSPVPFKKTEEHDLLVKPTKEAAILLRHIFENEQDIKWIEPSMLKKLVKRFNNEPDIMKILHQVSTEGHHNPYYGKDSHGIAWRDASKEGKTPFPIPSKVKDLDGVLGRDVPMGHGEPLMWMDTKYKISRKLIWDNNQKPLQINTRSDLIAHDEYIAVLNPSKHVVNIHIASLNDDFNKLAERGAPSARRRIQAAAKLAENGIQVQIVHDRFENPKLSSTMKWVNEVTRSGIARIDNIKQIKSFLKENIVKISDEQAEALNEMAEHVMKVKKRITQ